ncbi:MAG: glycerol dehydratase reactivase beta/small subunit family protein, partial [Propionibacteriaceae bacterium]|nr:glycerol dehydratase reactivase beta/small subunit family protein [Propionibacteriaceae bacterium]
MTEVPAALLDIVALRHVDEKRPAVEVHVHNRITELQLKEVLLGIEEESIPYTVTIRDNENPLELAHEAAVSSRLGVGVGV